MAVRKFDLHAYALFIVNKNVSEHSETRRHFFQALFFRSDGRRGSGFGFIAILLDFLASFLFGLLLFLFQFFLAFFVLIVDCWHWFILLEYDSDSVGIARKYVYYYSTA